MPLVSGVGCEHIKNSEGTPLAHPGWAASPLHPRRLVTPAKRRLRPASQ